MLTHLDTGEREQVVDEPRHAIGLGTHDGEEPLAGSRVIASRPLQRLHEAAQRGERCAQLMAGVGDEIGPHLGEAVLLGEVAHRQEQRWITVLRAAQV